jgi:hypothetical protein
MCVGSKAIELLSSQLAGKRKRGNFSENEMLMLTNMSDDVNNIVNCNTYGVIVTK